MCPLPIELLRAFPGECLVAIARRHKYTLDHHGTHVISSRAAPRWFTRRLRRYEAEIVELLGADFYGMRGLPRHEVMSTNLN
jgi:hypothetical protein